MTESAAVAPDQRATSSSVGRRLLRAVLIGATVLAVGFGIGQLRSTSSRPDKVDRSRGHSRIPGPGRRSAAVRSAAGSPSACGGCGLGGPSPRARRPEPERRFGGHGDRGAAHRGRCAGIGDAARPSSRCRRCGCWANGDDVRRWPGRGEQRRRASPTRDPRMVGSLPRSLSDAAAARIGSSDYVVGGWDGSTFNTSVYRYLPGHPEVVAGSLPGGIRYPAVGVVGGRLLIAGGETASGAATSAIRSFDNREKLPCGEASLSGGQCGRRRARRPSVHPRRSARRTPHGHDSLVGARDATRSPRGRASRAAVRFGCDRDVGRDRCRRWPGLNRTCQRCVGSAPEASALRLSVVFMGVLGIATLFTGCSSREPSARPSEPSTGHRTASGHRVAPVSTRLELPPVRRRGPLPGYLMIADQDKRPDHRCLTAKADRLALSAHE
jgi:hypothetical protein